MKKQPPIKTTTAFWCACCMSPSSLSAHAETPHIPHTFCQAPLECLKTWLCGRHPPNSPAEPGHFNTGPARANGARERLRSRNAWFAVGVGTGLTPAAWCKTPFTHRGLTTPKLELSHQNPNSNFDTTRTRTFTPNSNFPRAGAPSVESIRVDVRRQTCNSPACAPGVISTHHR